MPTATKASATTATCDGCWTEQTLRPSGTTLSTHKAGDGSRCPGKPVFDVKGSDSKISCVECGTEGTPLKTDNTRIKKHNDADGKPCAQRPGIKAGCPACGRRLVLRKGLLPVHQDIKAQVKCTHSARDPKDEVVKALPNARKVSVKEPAPKKAPAPKGVDAAWTKAQIFASAIEKAGWKTEVIVQKEDQAAIAVAKRGEEEITIMWEEARCVGGTIFHTFRSRKIALRNKNAAVQRALMTPDQILAEHSRVSQRARKVAAPKASARGKKTAGIRPEDEMAALRTFLPFDPKTADQQEIARALVSKTLTWMNRTSQKEQTGTVNANAKAIKVHKASDGSRQVTFFLLNSGAKTIRLDDIVSVG